MRKNGSPGNSLLFDFSSASTASGWLGVNDVVMGGLSEGSSVWDESGELVFSGTVSFDRGGGFSSIRSPAINGLSAGARGLAIRVRGDGKTYKLTVRTDRDFDGPSYQIRFRPPVDVWETIRLLFAEFVATYHGRRIDAPPIDPTAIRHLGFIISDRQEGPFELRVRRIGVI